MCSNLVAGSLLAFSLFQLSVVCSGAAGHILYDTAPIDSAYYFRSLGIRGVNDLQLILP